MKENLYMIYKWTVTEHDMNVIDGQEDLEFAIS